MSEFRVKKIANQMGNAAPDVDTAPLADNSKKVANTEFVMRAVDGAGKIDDLNVSTETVYSSSKVESELSSVNISLETLIKQQNLKIYFSGGF